MSIDLPHLIQTLPEPWCDGCGGDGYLIVIGRTAHYNLHHDCWQPSEEEEPCDNCAGTGSKTTQQSQLGRVNALLANLSEEHRSDLQNLYEPDRRTLLPESQHLLQDVLLDLEVELLSSHPAVLELQQLLHEAESNNHKRHPAGPGGIVATT